MKSLFSPIFSIPTNDISSTEISDLVAGFAGGFLTRIIGAFFRLLFIALGLLGGIISILLFTFTFIIWVLLPVVVPALIYLAGVVSLSIL